MLAASDISDARLEWPPGREEEEEEDAAGAAGANRTESGSRASGEGSVVGGRDGLDEDEEEEDCRW